MRLFDYHRDDGGMSLKGYIPLLIFLAMLTVTFVIPWIAGWIYIVWRVIG